MKEFFAFWFWLEEYFPSWYLYIGLAYAIFHFFLVLLGDLSLLRILAKRILWNTIIVPFILGIIWPISLLLYLSRNIWNLHHTRLFRHLYGDTMDDQYDQAGRPRSDYDYR